MSDRSVTKQLLTLTRYVPSVRDIPRLKRAPVLAESTLSGKWIPPTEVYVARDVDTNRERERDFTDAIINAIGDISVAEAQAAILKWRQEHA